MRVRRCRFWVNLSQSVCLTKTHIHLVVIHCSFRYETMKTCCSHLAVGVAGAALPPTGQHRGVLCGSATLAALLLHGLLIQWLRGAWWVSQGVCMRVWGHSVTGLCSWLRGPLPGLGVSLLGTPVMLNSLFQRLVGDEHRLAHLGGTTVRHWGQVWVGHGCRDLRLLFGGGTRVRVMGGAVGTEGLPL